MKKIFFIAAIAATAFIQKGIAQIVATSVADSTIQSSQILDLYFNIKNALVAGNANAASVNSERFVTVIDESNTQAISEDTRKALLQDARRISVAKNIQKQRDHFASLSTSMYAFAKAAKLNMETIYYAYCPMKKSYWLSSDKAIRNPYYGNVMLTCGEIRETIE